MQAVRVWTVKREVTKIKKVKVVVRCVLLVHSVPQPVRLHVKHAQRVKQEILEQIKLQKMLLAMPVPKVNTVMLKEAHRAQNVLVVSIKTGQANKAVKIVLLAITLTSTKKDVQLHAHEAVLNTA